MMAGARPAWRARAARLAPYAQESLARGEDLARRLHSEELVPEHWLAALLDDEGCGATRIVLHAFADPATIGGEVLALCPGIMVVGSGRTLPFSVRGVAALRAARAVAAERGAGTLEPGHLCLAAGRELDAKAQERLATLSGAELAAAAGEHGSPEEVPLATTGSLFKRYSASALRALGASARAAGALGRTAIGPAHLLLGCLEVDDVVCARTGLTAGRARIALAGSDEDRTPLPEGPLGASPELARLLDALPDGGDSVAALGWLLSSGSAEVVALLQRQKVTLALYERCRGAFTDA